MKSFLSRLWKAKPKLAVSAVGILTFGLAVAFSSGATGAEQPQADDNSYDIPSYYPDDYAKLIEQSKNESGGLTIYASYPLTSFTAVFREFRKKYPWVTDISMLNMGSDTVFQRVLSAQATGNVNMDLAISNGPSAWAKFLTHGEVLTAYDSPELAKLPDFAELSPNVYAISLGPLLMAYNTALMQQAPTGVTSLAKIVASNPDKFKNRIEIRSPDSSFGFLANYAFISNTEGAWDAYAELLPLARLGVSSGSMLEKVISGEFKVAFPLSALVHPVIRKSAGLVEYVYPDDGVVVLPLGVGVVAGAPNPATAKLFIDFILSQKGQVAVTEGGLYAYRKGTPDDAPEQHTYQELVDEVGKDSIIFVEYESVSKGKVSEFKDHFFGLME